MRQDHSVRAMDITSPANPEVHDFVQGSVNDASALSKALEGVNAIIIGHMASRGSYFSVEAPFDINVKGTAQIFETALKRGIRRVVLISSTAVVHRQVKEGLPISRESSYSPTSIYALTKVLQENIARYYHEEHGFEVACLRPTHIICEDSFTDKYGHQYDKATWQFIDPRDIARAAIAAIHLPKLGFEVFHLMTGPEAETFADVAHTRSILGWEPLHRFDALREKAESTKAS